MTCQYIRMAWKMSNREEIRFWVRMKHEYFKFNGDYLKHITKIVSNFCFSENDKICQIKKVEQKLKSQEIKTAICDVENFLQV